MNNTIFPCLWFDGNAKESAHFYGEIFNGKITDESSMVINLELFGQKIMLLNAGPQFKKNASISFMVLCETEEEVQKYWDYISEKGIVLMELGEYPWSKKYGWIQDRFGVTWQFYLGENPGTQKIIPTLMFLHQNNGKASEAMKFYTKIFPHSKIGHILKYGDGVGNETHEIPENIQHADFEINGYTFFCMDSSYDHSFDFSEGISIVVMTENQEETDYLWNSLVSNGGEESMCGWLKDEFGVSWQITPKKLIELINNTDREKSIKAMTAMMQMKKIDIAALEKAVRS